MEYKVVQLTAMTLLNRACKELEAKICEMAALGWHVRTCQYIESQMVFVVLFEREIQDIDA